MTETTPARLRRDLDHGLVAGVLAGFGRRLDVDPVIVRIGFVLLCIVTGGIAIPAYAIAWALMPTEGSQPGRGRRVPRIFRGSRVAIGVGLLTLAGLLAFRELGIWWSDALVWPLVLAATGVALLLRQSRLGTGADAERTEAEREAKAPETVGAADEEPRRTPFAQLYSGGFGVALVVGAALLFLSSNNALGAARDAAFTAIVVLVALALILAPFLWRLGRNLASERAERIRSQERAELAAHLHDSVLQTLVLVQKRADQPREVASLARRQERELRGWLYGPDRDAGDSFAAALREAAERVEDAHGIAIDVVTVGDRDLDERRRALVAAAREALTNAAKFAPDAGPVSLYSEVENGRVQVFVHDRGPGFDLGDVPEDRRGVRESIIGRMKRHGGEATIRSRAGEGTEVELTLSGRDERKVNVHVPTVVIVDDHEIFRRGVRAELEGLVDVRGEAGDVESAVRRIESTRPDVVLLDVHMPGGGGVEVIRQVAKLRPAQRFLALSVSDEPEDVIAVIRAGRPRLRHQVDLRRRSGRRGAPRERRRRGVLAAARGLRARRLRRPDPRERGRPRARPAHGPRARGAAADRARLSLQGDRPRALDLAEDRRGPRQRRAAQAPALEPPRARPLGGGAAAGGLTERPPARIGPANGERPWSPRIGRVPGRSPLLRDENTPQCEQGEQSLRADGSAPAAGQRGARGCARPGARMTSRPPRPPSGAGSCR